uniref:C-type natriuretic peptide isoform X1 n=1 Tax=Callithrix jacchus TaxID=9483 RepID=UPI0023DD518B|nr:C-type natriuretic peptide isoform X1 [Callithrix jacchus]
MLGRPGRAFAANGVPQGALLCSSKCSTERARRAAGSLRGGLREGSPPPRPPPGPWRCRVRGAIGPGCPVGGRMTSAAGWIIKARAESRAQSAPSRRRAALGPCSPCSPASLLRTCLPVCPPTRAPSLPPVCAPRPQRHHAPLPAAGLRPAAHAALTPALRSQARGAAEGPANPAGRGAGGPPGCGRLSEEGRQGSRGRGRQPQGRSVATAPGPARGHQVAGRVGPPCAGAPQRAQTQSIQQEELVQGLLRPQAGPNRLHERPGMLVWRPLAADWKLAPLC